MSDPISIISSQSIKVSDFIDFLLDQKDAVIEDFETGQSRISKGYQHVWIFIYNDGLRHRDTDELGLIKQVLGDEPRTLIVLEISRTEGSDHLAIEFACRFAERWPCIVDDLRGTLYLPKELQQMKQSGQRIL